VTERESLAAAQGLTRIYVVVTAEWGGHDVVGCSVTADRAWFSHVSSDTRWLTRDTTDGFSDRRAQLEAAYPDGYEVVLINPGAELPAEIAHHFTPGSPLDPMEGEES
jgi:hypothetical protein